MATRIRERGRADCDLAVKSPKNGPGSEKTSEVGEGVRCARARSSGQRPLWVLGRRLDTECTDRAGVPPSARQREQAARTVTSVKAGAQDGARSRPSPGRRK